MYMYLYYTYTDIYIHMYIYYNMIYLVYTSKGLCEDAAETAKVAESANAMKMDCQRDLDKAMPALNAAIEVGDGIQ